MFQPVLLLLVVVVHSIGLDIMKGNVPPLTCSLQSIPWCTPSSRLQFIIYTAAGESLFISLRCTSYDDDDAHHHHRRPG